MLTKFERTDKFDKWLRGLKDTNVRARILARIRSAQAGNFGDSSPVGSGVSEMRIHLGAGYRVYYMRLGDLIYLLLAGGDKSTQSRDIPVAIALAEKIRREQSR